MESAFATLVGHQMLNTRYIIFGQMTDPLAVPGATGFAWVASDWQWAASPDDEINMTAALDAPVRAVVHEEYQGSMNGMSPGATGTIQLVNYTPDYLEYESNLSAEGLGVFSEIWYPEGWVARIDGEPVETLRANYVLRALKVPAGEHTITWEYAPKHASWMDVMFNVFLLLFVLGTGWWGWKASNEEHQGNAQRA
jgi:hypothetical protein